MLAVFPDEAHGGFIRVLETIFMILLDTVAPQKSFHRFKTEEGDACYRKIVKAAGCGGGRPWNGLNSTWSIGQGLQQWEARLEERSCLNCGDKGKDAVGWYAADGKMWDTYRCVKCYRWHYSNQEE